MLEVRSSATLRFRLLGQAALEASWGPVRISSRKGFALLCYLAMHRGRAVSRAVLADLLWGDRDEAAARQNLRQAIHTLRRDLGPALAPILLAGDETIALTVDGCQVDALDFSALAQDLDPDVRLRCLDIPWGTFLEGFSPGSEAFEEWLAAERHRLDAIGTRTFSALAAQLDASGDGNRAILALERLIAIDPAEEERHRRLLKLEWRHRGADVALARARELAAMLRRELDVAPEPATTALVAGIRQAAGASGADAARLMASPASEPVAAAAPPRSIARPLWFAGPLLALGFAALAGLAAVGALQLGLDQRPATRQSREQAGPPPATGNWMSPPLPSGRTASSGEPGRPAIPMVVLPFKTYDDTPAVRLLADMVGDEVTTTLSRIRYFRVISRQTARSLHAEGANVIGKARDLGVRYVLDGSIRSSGEKLRVAVDLTDAATGAVVWSAGFERDDRNRPGMPDEIVQRIVRELQVGSYAVESARLSSDADADALSYRGMAAMQLAFSNISLEAYQKPRGYFLQALERDPANVMARLGLATYHVSVAVQRLVPDGDAHLKRAEDIITQVIRQHPSISGAHHVLGVILQGSGRLEQAIPAFERAIEINPSSAGSHAHIGFVLARLGRPKEGIEHIRYAMRLSPRDPALPIWTEFAASTELELDRYDVAISEFRRAIELAPSYPRPLAGLAAALALAGRLDEARAAVERLKELVPDVREERLYRRFGRHSARSPRLQAGLRLVLVRPADH